MKNHDATHRILAGALCACTMSAALAGSASAAGRTTVDDFAAATGLTKSEVQMVLGARTTHFEYFTSYARAQRRFVEVLGTQRYNELMAGKPVTLDNGVRVALAIR